LPQKLEKVVLLLVLLQQEEQQQPESVRDPVQEQVHLPLEMQEAS